jgi:hypothetical protein
MYTFLQHDRFLASGSMKRNCKSQMPHLNCTGDTRITVTWLMCGVWLTDPSGQLDLSAAGDGHRCAFPHWACSSSRARAWLPQPTSHIINFPT